MRKKMIDGIKRAARLLLFAAIIQFAATAPATAYNGAGFFQKIIKGKITDDEGKALAGVSISVKGTTKGTFTNDNGEFSIDANPGDILNISTVGYASLTVKVNNETSFSFKLQAKNKEIAEVVVVGVQTQVKRKSTVAISSVLSKDIENLPSPSIDQLLQGRIAGLNVQIGSGEPGVAPTVVVRGNTRVNTNIADANVAQARALSGPLYVIDGIPTNPEDISNSIDATGTNYLAGININDIENVDVQKDAAATAAWGSRGANGVIYIKTKRGRSTKPEFRVNIYGGVTQKPELLNTVTGAEERKLPLRL